VYIKRVKGVHRFLIMHLPTIAALVVNVLTEDQATDLILDMHKTEEGCEALRLIVRDNVGGASELIANALWFRGW
jgi:hypothetical protein